MAKKKKEVEQYGVYRLTSDPVLDAIPELSNVEIFTCTEKKMRVEVVDDSGETSVEDRIVTLNGLDNDFVMRYIIMMYAKGSSFVENYPKIGKRKTKVMEKLGVVVDSKNRYEKNISDMLTGKNRLIQRKIAAFLTLQQPTDWAIMVKTQEDLEEILSKPLPEDPTKQMNRQKAIEACREAIEKCKERLMYADRSRLLEMEVEEFLAYTSLGIRPEEFVMNNYKYPKPHDSTADQFFPEVGN